MAQPLPKPQILPTPAPHVPVKDWPGISANFRNNTDYLRTLVLNMQTYLNRVYQAVAPLQPLVATVAQTQSPYAVGMSDTFIAASASASADTIIDLPVATGSGRVITIKKVDANAHNIVVTAAGSDTIDGAATYSVSTQYQTVTVIDAATGSWLTF